MKALLPFDSDAKSSRQRDEKQGRDQIASEITQMQAGLRRAKGRGGGRGTAEAETVPVKMRCDFQWGISQP